MKIKKSTTKIIIILAILAIVSFIIYNYNYKNSYNVYNISFESKPFMNEKTLIYGLLFMPRGKDNVPALVFLPGGGGTKESRAYIGEFIASQGYAVLVIDQRGIGQTGGKYLGLTGLMIALSACGTERDNATNRNPTTETQNYRPDTRNTTTPKTDSGTISNNNNIDAGQEDSGTNYIPQPDASTTETPDAGTPNRTNYSPIIEIGMTELVTSPGKDLHIKIFGTDQDGDTLEYKFECGDGRTTEWNEDNKIIHRYDRIGVYDLIAYARDRNGGETNTRLEVRVQDGETNNPPVVRLTCVTDTTDDLADCEINEEGIKVYTTGEYPLGRCWDFSGTYDPDGDNIVDWGYVLNADSNPLWAFGSLSRPKTCGGNGNAEIGRTYNSYGEALDSKEAHGVTTRFLTKIIENN